MTKGRYLLLAATALAAATATPAWAADPAPAPAQTPAQGDPQQAAGQAPDAGAGPREDVVVTAQKREQSLVDVPQSVSVVTGATLERQQATNFQDYLKLVPGLQLDQSTPGFGRLVLRGLNTGGVASTVAVYQDETVFGSSTSGANGAILAGDFDTFDVARVEVLRGPQGTLYGANSLGGVVKYVTVEPNTAAFEARARGGAELTRGGEESYYGSAVLNVPIASTLALRASGFYRDFGGFIDSIGTAGSDVENDINDTRSYGGRAALLFRPSDGFSVKLSALIQKLENGASSSVDADPTSSQTLYGRLTQSQFVPESSDVDYRVYSGLVTLDLGFADLVSATSYSSVEQDFISDLTPQFAAVVQAVFGAPNNFLLDQVTRSRRFTQEVRLQSPTNRTFEWTLGGYYNRERGLIDQAFQAVQPGTLTPIAGLPLLGVATVRDRYREWAGFANATVYFGDRFDLTLGARYSDISQSGDQQSDGVLAGGAATIPAVRAEEDVFTYSVAPKFKLNDRSAVYARVAKGYRPGGPNVIPPGAPADVPRVFTSDTVTSYELGIKAETQDRSFSVDIAGFYIDWNDVQLFAVANGFGVNTNGGKARSTGVEFTVTARPTTGFNVSVNGAITEAELRDDTPALTGGRRGDRLPFSPKYSLGVNADYEWSLSDSTEAFVGGSLRSLSEQTANYNLAFRTANGRQRTVPSYEVADLRAGLDFGRFVIEAYAKNLFDVDGKTSLTPPGNQPLGAVSTGVIRPRTVGLALTAEY